MSTAPRLATDVTAAQPRRVVIDRAWREIGPGVELLSGGDGAPLRRTVKRILDPLVFRLRANPQFSAAVLEPDVAAALADVIAAHATELRAGASWFALLKSERRRLRITTGNAQELYFPVCFELAVTRGAPGPYDGAVAETVLRDLHDDRDRTAIEHLNRFAADDHVVTGLARQLELSWSDVRPGPTMPGPFLAGLSTVLGDADGHSARAARQRVWAALVADSTPYNFGAMARTESADLPWSIVEVGLSSIAPQQCPRISAGEPGRSEVTRPLDRPVIDRVRATLRRAMDREELPDIPLLCSGEVDRACAPWGLLAEDKQATLVAGIEVAVDLAPLRESATPRYDLACRIQTRLRKEAYVLHARRYLADGAPLHPRQRQVIDELAAFARPYTSRLWARLHGRDVWQESCSDVDDMRSVLEGVARSVSLDHRQRIKAMLEVAEDGAMA